jgi:hypothetical protein
MNKSALKIPPRLRTEGSYTESHGGKNVFRTKTLCYSVTSVVNSYFFDTYSSLWFSVVLIFLRLINQYLLK